ncbi:PLD nuclease N-terminal domain-containing protein [Mucilaginibacter agri]|uniref:Cardiolipin synthase N-terminal domain-containing protein n=1 Tax=Mucilaginibacter agri TaxID=2695265 RepID=A0A965ZFB7_9SPHI|nr:PLD nuclease N-terminal domain-containing protein [Mucilaginibacter agri]NCD68954.1 hypothetical protein [Mucilaginibacter agri]
MSDTSSTLFNIIVVLFLVWLVVLIVAIITLLNRKDISTLEKAFWAAVIFFAPVVGLIFYIIYGIKKSDRSSDLIKHKTDRLYKSIFTKHPRT